MPITFYFMLPFMLGMPCQAFILFIGSNQHKLAEKGFCDKGFLLRINKKIQPERGSGPVLMAVVRLTISMPSKFQGSEGLLGMRWQLLSQDRV